MSDEVFYPGMPDTRCRLTRRIATAGIDLMPGLEVLVCSHDNPDDNADLAQILHADGSRVEGGCGSRGGWCVRYSTIRDYCEPIVTPAAAPTNTESSPTEDVWQHLNTRSSVRLAPPVRPNVELLNEFFNSFGGRETALRLLQSPSTGLAHGACAAAIAAFHLTRGYSLGNVRLDSTQQSALMNAWRALNEAYQAVITGNEPPVSSAPDLHTLLEGHY